MINRELEFLTLCGVINDGMYLAKGLNRKSEFNVSFSQLVHLLIAFLDFCCKLCFKLTTTLCSILCSTIFYNRTALMYSTQLSSFTCRMLGSVSCLW